MWSGWTSISFSFFHFTPSLAAPLSPLISFSLIFFFSILLSFCLWLCSYSNSLVHQEYSSFKTTMCCAINYQILVLTQYFNVIYVAFTFGLQNDPYYFFLLFGTTVSKTQSLVSVWLGLDTSNCLVKIRKRFVLPTIRPLVLFLRLYNNLMG